MTKPRNRKQKLKTNLHFAMKPMEPMKPMSIVSSVPIPSSSFSSLTKKTKTTICLITFAFVTFVAINLQLFTQSQTTLSPSPSPTSNSNSNSNIYPTNSSQNLHNLLKSVRTNPNPLYTNLTRTITKAKGAPSYTLLSTTPKDANRFTQGLEYHPLSQTMFESVGLYHQSNIFSFNYPNDENTSNKLSTKQLPPNQFGEGLTLTKDNELIVLTWQEQAMTRFSFDSNSADIKNELTKIEEISFTTSNNEGWGAAFMHDKNEIAISDGSDNLMFWNADTYTEITSKRVRVHKISATGTKQYVSRINELEYYEGDILANVWFKEEVLRIDVTTGFVKVVYNFKDIWPNSERPRHADVFNGIAALPDKSLVVTGKLWDRYYHIKLND